MLDVVVSAPQKWILLFKWHLKMRVSWRYEMLQIEYVCVGVYACMRENESKSEAEKERERLTVQS